MSRPVLAIIFDEGSASPRQLLDECAGLCDLIFIWDESAGAAPETREVLEQLVPVVSGSGRRLAELIERVRARGVTNVAVFSDRTMPLALAIASALGLPFHTAEVVRNLADKGAQRAALSRAAVATPWFVVVETPEQVAEIESRVPFPAVIKPVAGASSRHTYLVADADDLRERAAQAFRSEGRMVIEELIAGDASVAGPGTGDFVSVESIVTGGVAVFSAVTGKFPLEYPFRESGGFYPATLSKEWQDAAIQEANCAVAALGVEYSVCHTELKLTADGPRVIEVNGRVGGFMSDLLHSVCGLSLIRAAILCALRLPPVTEVEPPSGVAFVLTVQPPAEATTLTGIGGLRSLLAVAGVRTARLLKAPGATLDWRLGSNQALAVITGYVTDHADLQRAVKECYEALSPTFS